MSRSRKKGVEVLLEEGNKIAFGGRMAEVTEGWKTLLTTIRVLH